MRAWAYLMGGLLVWAVHFFVLYAAASIFLTSTATRAVTAAATIICLSGAAWLAASGWRRRRESEDRFRGWMHYLAALSGAAACIAILWQALPALLI